MHIIHVFPSRSWGGAEIYALELAQRQCEKGFTVSFWGLRDSKMIQEAGLRKIPVLTESLPQRLNPFSLPQIIKVLRREQATHLHLHWSGGPWAFLGIKFFSNVKLIYHNHMWIKHYKRDPFHQIVYGFLDHMIVAGERAFAAARKYLPISKNKIRILPYGIDLKRLVQSSRSEFGFSPDHFIFGMFSRVDRQKGTKEFLLALEECTADPRVHAVLVGDPTLNEIDAKNYQNEIDELLKREPLKSRVHRFPSRPDYLRLLQACDVLVLPSYHESYSLLILAAFMLSKPVISTNSGGTPDLVERDRGWLVAPRDVPGLVHAMQEALNNKEQVQEKGLSAREYVVENHSFEQIIEKTKTLYQ